MIVYIKSLLTVAVMLLLAACDSDDYDPTYTYGEMSATVNGQPWLGEAELFLDRRGLGYHVTGYIANNQGISTDQFNFSKITPLPGPYVVFDTSAQIPDLILRGLYTTSNSHGDVITGLFVPSYDRSQNVLEVLEADTVNHEMTARFEGLFLRGLNDPDHVMQAHDSVRVTDGWFKARVRP